MFINSARLGFDAFAALYAYRFGFLAAYARVILEDTGPVLVYDRSRGQEQTIARKATEHFLEMSFTKQEKRGTVYGPNDPEGALRAAVVIAHCMQSTKVGTVDTYFCSKYLADAKKAHTGVYDGACSEMVEPQPLIAEIPYTALLRAINADKKQARAMIDAAVTNAGLRNAVQTLRQEAETPGETRYFKGSFEHVGEPDTRMKALTILHDLADDPSLTKREEMIRAMHALWVCSVRRDRDRPHWAHSVCEKEVANALRVYGAAAPADRPHGTMGLVLCSERDGPFAPVPVAHALNTIEYLVDIWKFGRTPWEATGAVRIRHLLDNS